MASLSRHIHLQTNFFWRPLAEIAPDMQIQLPPSESGVSSPAPTGQPETEQQMQQEDKDQNKDAQSLEDLFKGPAPATPPPGPAPPSK